MCRCYKVTKDNILGKWDINVQMLQSNQKESRMRESKYSIKYIGSYLATITSFGNLNIIWWLPKEENQDKVDINVQMLQVSKDNQDWENQNIA